MEDIKQKLDSIIVKADKILATDLILQKVDRTQNYITILIGITIVSLFVSVYIMVRYMKIYEYIDRRITEAIELNNDKYFEKEVNEK